MGVDFFAVSMYCFEPLFDKSKQGRCRNERSNRCSSGRCCSFSLGGGCHECLPLAHRCGAPRALSCRQGDFCSHGGVGGLGSLSLWLPLTVLARVGEVPPSSGGEKL